MKYDKITENNIQEMVDSFYEKVLQDTLLRPIFINTIGEGAEKWEPHLKTMYSFWSSLMLGTGRYNGNVFQKHKDLPTFDHKLFDRWLDLFAQTACGLYIEEIANLYIIRSQRIAESLKIGLSLPFKR